MAREATPHGMIQRILNRRRKRNPPTVPPPSGRPANLNFRDIGLGDIEIDPQAARGAGASPVQQAGANVSGWVGGGDAPAAEPMIQQNPPDITREMFPRGGPAQAQQQQAVSAGPNQLLADQLRAAIQQRAEIANRELNTSEGKLTNLYQGMRMGARQAALGGGDLGYTLGSTIAGGIRGMFVPEEYERYKRDRDTATASARVEGLQAEQKAMLDAQAKEQEMALKQVDLINRIGQPGRDAEKAQIEARKAVTGLKYYSRERPDLREAVAQAGYDPDTFPEFDERNLVERNLEDGTPILVSGDKALEAEIARDYRQAQMDFDAEKFNAREWQDYQKRVERWIEDDNKRGEKQWQMANEGNQRWNDARAIRREADELAASAEDANDPQAVRAKAAALRTRADQMESEARTLLNNSRNLQSSPRPQPPKARVSAPQLGKSKISRSALENELNSRKIRRGSPEWNRVMEAAGY